MSEGVPGDFPFTPLLTSANVLQRLALSVERVTSELSLDVSALCQRFASWSYATTDSHSNPWPLDNSLWTSLTPTAQNLEHVLCPGLQSVKFVEFSATSDNALLEFIQARTGPNFAGIARLSKVQAHFRRRMQVDIVPTLQQPLTTGLIFPCVTSILRLAPTRRGSKFWLTVGEKGPRIDGVEFLYRLSHRDIRIPRSCWHPPWNRRKHLVALFLSTSFKFIPLPNASPA
ncbi:hypothetical protein B0H13DRAFT_2406754 [Mycena leptocephala]|nr:hypothetical protein B0H13DRAFT_2406754 [Mycena leptocephala]